MTLLSKYCYRNIWKCQWVSKNLKYLGYFCTPWEHDIWLFRPSLEQDTTPSQGLGQTDVIMGVIVPVIIIYCFVHKFFGGGGDRDTCSVWSVCYLTGVRFQHGLTDHQGCGWCRLADHWLGLFSLKVVWKMSMLAAVQILLLYSFCNISLNLDLYASTTEHENLCLYYSTVSLGQSFVCRLWLDQNCLSYCCSSAVYNNNFVNFVKSHHFLHLLT